MFLDMTRCLTPERLGFDPAQFDEFRLYIYREGSAEFRMMFAAEADQVDRLIDLFNRHRACWAEKGFRVQAVFNRL